MVLNEIIQTCIRIFTHIKCSNVCVYPFERQYTNVKRDFLRLIYIFKVNSLNVNFLYVLLFYLIVNMFYYRHVRKYIRGTVV